VLDEIIVGLWAIANGGRLIVGQDFNLSFISLHAGQPTMCDVPIHLLINTLYTILTLTIYYFNFLINSLTRIFLGQNPILFLGNGKIPNNSG
jgi:hypothetical protein